MSCYIHVYTYVYTYLYMPETWVFGMKMEGQRSLQILRILVSYKGAEVEEMPWADAGSSATFSKREKI